MREELCLWGDGRGSRVPSRFRCFGFRSLGAWLHLNCTRRVQSRQKWAEKFKQPAARTTAYTGVFEVHIGRGVDGVSLKLPPSWTGTVRGVTGKSPWSGRRLVGAGRASGGEFVRPLEGQDSSSLSSDAGQLWSQQYPGGSRLRRYCDTNSPLHEYRFFHTSLGSLLYYLMSAAYVHRWKAVKPVSVQFTQTTIETSWDWMIYTFITFTCVWYSLCFFSKKVDYDCADLSIWLWIPYLYTKMFNNWLFLATRNTFIEYVHIFMTSVLGTVFLRQ